MSCPNAQILADRLATPSRGLVAHHSATQLSAALNRYFPGETEQVLQRALDVERGYFTVFGTLLPIGPPGATLWWREPRTGAVLGARPRPPVPESFSPVPESLKNIPESLGASPIGVPPASDVKSCWAVGRGDTWVALACGAVASASAPERAKRFIRAFQSSVRDFVAHNPIDRSVQWTCAMEAGLRALCLGQALALASSTDPGTTSDPDFALALARLAVVTSRFILAHLEDTQAIPNNHLVADWVGLLACALLLPEWPEAKRWRARAARGLSQAILVQTHPDGTSFEGSIPYHRLALELFTAGALLARRLRLRLDPLYWSRLAALYEAARALLTTQGELPQIGDNDAGRVFSFRERAALDGRHLLPLGAALFGAPTLRVRSRHPDAEADAAEVLWLLGPAAVEQGRDAPCGPPARSATFPSGGFHVLRRGRFEVAISCGRNGQAGVGGHSHNDKLAFELRLDHRLIVCDPGSPSYTGDPALRTHFRSTRAHATLMVDDAEQAPLSARPFALPEAAHARVLAFGATPRLERFAGEHLGYAALGVVHQREFLLFDDQFLLVDHVIADGSGQDEPHDAHHLIALRFPFPALDPERGLRWRPLTYAEQARFRALPELRPPTSFTYRSIELGPAHAPHALLAVAVPPAFAARLEPAHYSPGYGQLRPTCTALFTGPLQGSATLFTIVLPLS